MKESNSLATDARSTAAPRPPPGFTAHLTGMSLIDLVKLQSLTEASGVFLVVSGERTGMLHFARGQLFHAETRELRGNAAALEILAWTGGEFIRSERALSGSASVASPLDTLIAGALGLTGLVPPARSLTSSTGIRRRGGSHEPAASAAEADPSPSPQPSLRAAATPGVAAGPAPRRTPKLLEGRAVASARVSPLGELVEGHGPSAEVLATRVAYAARLQELIAQAMGSGEPRSLRARYADSELVIQPQADQHLFGCIIVPEPH